jgi:hypothetical protein
LLVNNNYGSIPRVPFATNPNLTIADVDLDGKLDLGIGDFTGSLKWYRSFLENATNVFPADSIWYQNLVLNQKLNRNLGNFVSPAMADLNGDGFPELAIGTQGGGIHLLVNRLGPNRINERYSQNNPQIYPNPINPGENLRWNGGEISSIKIFDSVGKCLFSKENEVLQANEIQIPKLPSGTFFLRLGSLNSNFNFKLIIN